MNTIYIRRATVMIVATVFSAIFIGAALTSAKKQAFNYSSQGPTPQLYFRKMEDEEATEWASDNEAEKEGVELFSGDSKIYPLDKETVFFFGGLRTPAAAIRSFLLRSGDGGKTWRDAMSPVYGSEVCDVFFLDGRSGWALTLWTNESQGDVTLFSSEDGGITWRKVSDVPKRDWTGLPVGMKFADENNGEIDMRYEDDLAVLKTKDGGRTWAESRTVSHDEYEKRERETDQSEQPIVQGKDGSQWRLAEKGKRVRVLRRMKANETWQELCAIPMKYGYSDGQILVRQKK